MANPYKAKFNTECQNCDNSVEKGELMYANDGMFICGQCAQEGDLICTCGNYKKEQYKTCYTCRAPTPVVEESESWDPFGDIVKEAAQRKKDNELPF